MPKQTVEALVEGGKATAAPPLGPALGPLGVNIGMVIAEINKKTASFQGIQVPIKVQVEAGTKDFEIIVGTPPASALVLKEAGIEKGSGNPLMDKVADLRIEQIIKIAKMKEDSLLGKSLKAKIKEVIGTCNSMGILVEGKQARDALREVEKGVFDEEIKLEKTQLSEEELQELEAERKKLLADIERRREEFTTTAKTIIAGMQGKPRGEIKTKLMQAGVPTVLINELLPVEAAAGAAAPAADQKKA
jgi:large subunit ribosomal protein L11